MNEIVGPRPDPGVKPRVPIFSGLPGTVAAARQNGPMTDKKTLLLVDGSSYLYRAFHAHARPARRARRQRSPATGAIRGMINMLQPLRARRTRPTTRACVFDAQGKTFRDDWYPEYKANALADARRPGARRSSRSTRPCGCSAGRC